MKKKIRCKLLASAIIGALSLGNVVTVNASSILDMVEVTETDADHSEDISYSLLRGNNLNYGYGDITEISSNEVYISASTQCHHECEEVYLNMYLERKINGSYASYKSWSFSGSNTDEVYRGISVIVPSGYYYRLRGYHVAIDGGARESTTTMTGGILVD